MSGDRALSAFLDAHSARFGYVADEVLAVKLAEECGEVASEVYRAWENPAAASGDGFGGLRDEIGDVVLVAAVIARAHGWELADVVSDRAGHIMRRWAGIHDEQGELL